MIFSNEKRFIKSAALSVRPKEKLVSVMKLMQRFPIAVILLEKHQSPTH